MLTYLLVAAVAAAVFLAGVGLAARRSSEHSHRAVSAWNLRAARVRAAEADVHRARQR